VEEKAAVLKVSVQTVHRDRKLARVAAFGAEKALPPAKRHR
jgi:hypothetical protein